MIDLDRRDGVALLTLNAPGRRNALTVGMAEALIACCEEIDADESVGAVVVPEVAQTTALGAAYLAGVTTGLWAESDLAEMWKEDARYEPSMSDDERQSLLADWRRALERSRRWVITDDE